MDSLNKIKRLAGIPIDLSKPANAAATIRIPTKLLSEAAKVPQHKGEMAPKTKDNMKARVKHIEAALEALELARESLHSIPAIDYMEDIPSIIKQLHQMLHGDDGTGGVHHLARTYKSEFDNTVFPEDVEEEKRKAEEEQQMADAGITGDEVDTSKKKKTNESATESNPAPEGKVKSDGLGFAKQKDDPSKENKKPFKLAPDSTPIDQTMYMDGEGDVEKDPAENGKSSDDKVQESKKPEWLEKKEVEAEEKEGKKVSKAEKKKVEEAKKTEKRCPDCGELGEIRGHMGCQYPSDEEDCAMTETAKFFRNAGIDPTAGKAKEITEAKKSKKPKWLEKKEVEAEEKEGKKVGEKEKEKVEEAQGPLFARDAEHPKHGSEPTYPSWADGTKPNNVVSADDGPSLYYPNGSKHENASQLSANPYNENQAVKVPAQIKTALKTEADIARKLAETFTMRKDWDNKNFHENMANAFDTLNGFLDKGTVYGIKEAQVFMTSLMSPIMNKIPAEVIKYVAAGGTVRSLKSYMKDVKEPTTGVVFQQDSNGVK